MTEIKMKSVATVRKKDGKPKDGRGFSREELRKAELDLKRALKLKIPVDLRRRSVHEENVEVLKARLKEVAKSKKSRA
jgi:large subunit ribosomal protein L13e